MQDTRYDGAIAKITRWDASAHATDLTERMQELVDEPAATSKVEPTVSPPPTVPISLLRSCPGTFRRHRPLCLQSWKMHVTIGFDINGGKISSRAFS